MPDRQDQRHIMYRRHISPNLWNTNSPPFSRGISSCTYHSTPNIVTLGSSPFHKRSGISFTGNFSCSDANLIWNTITHANCLFFMADRAQIHIAGLSTASKAPNVQPAVATPGIGHKSRYRNHQHEASGQSHIKIHIFATIATGT